MEKLKQLIISVMLWIFVVFCLILAIGMPFGVGTVLMLLAAIMAAPLPIMRRIWAAVIGLFPQKKKPAFMSKQKYIQQRKTRSKLIKFCIISMVFLFGFVFGMAATETSTPVDPMSEKSSLSTETLNDGPSGDPIVILPEAPAEEAIEPSSGLPTEYPEPTETPTEAPTIPENSTFSIHFIDVGQADAALVECDGHYLLIDGGNKDDSSKIYSVLKNASVPKLDIVVASHADEDHIGGIPGALNYTTADLTLCPVRYHDTEAFNDFLKYVDQNGGGITVPNAGDTYSLGSADVEILGVNCGSNNNNSSIIMRIVYGETSFLFTGDAGQTAEETVLNTVSDLSATVLKVGHHGSDSSTSQSFLKAVSPEYAVVSVGEDNTYGYPTETVMTRLENAGVTTFRTDLQGDIYCVSDGKTVAIEPSRNKDADVFSGPIVVEKPTEASTEAPTEAPDEGQDYVANKNTKKFHYPSCSSAKKIKEKNRLDFHGTREELIKKGYEPCGNCHP